MYNMQLGITAFPNQQLPKKGDAEETSIPAKLLAILRKYKFNWRIEQLSKQVGFKTAKKFTPEPVQLIQATPKQEIVLRKDIEYRCDHISRPLIRYLVVTKRAYRRLGKKFVRRMNKHIKRSWRSTYNYYRNIMRMREMKARRGRVRRDSKALQKKLERLKQAAERMAVPKPASPPEPLPERKRMNLELLKERMETLATPKSYHSRPTFNPFKVRKSALTYEITEEIVLLTKPPERYLIKIPELIPGKVKRGALKAQASPRVLELAVPKKHRENATATDESDDPWKISPNALKYKPTPRILELAKPLERE